MGIKEICAIGGLVATLVGTGVKVVIDILDHKNGKKFRSTKEDIDEFAKQLAKYEVEYRVIRTEDI